MFGRHYERQAEEGGRCGGKHFRGGRGFWGEMGEAWGRHGRQRFGGDFGGRHLRFRAGIDGVAATDGVGFGTWLAVSYGF